MSTTSNTFNTSTTGAKNPAVGQPGYLQQAYEGAANMATAATTTISNALGSKGATDTITSYRNQQPHTEGVGDLGTSSEGDVARLPEERANPEPFNGRDAADSSASNSAITDPINIPSHLNARNPPVPYPETGSGVAAPAKRHSHTNQPISGVGDLGTRSEVDVVRLPEERANPDPLAGSYGTDTNTYGTDTNTGTSTSIRPDENHRHGGIVGTVKDITQEGHSGGYTGSNHDTDHGLGMPHREDREVGGRDEGAVGTSAAGAGATNLGQGDFQDRQPGQEQQVHGHAPAPAGPSSQDNTSDSMEGQSQSPTDGKGPSKLDKLKGNLLIAKGKLTHGQEEIERGRNLKTIGKPADTEKL